MNNARAHFAGPLEFLKGALAVRWRLILPIAVVAGALLTLLVLPAYAQSGDEPLTARFLADTGPANHGGDGQTFTIRIEFSEDIDTSFRVLRDQALEVEGGAARKFKRVNGSSSLWEIHVEPNSDADVRLTLPETTDCNAADAVCTASDKPLSGGVAITIPGPAPAPEPEPTPTSTPTPTPTATPEPTPEADPSSATNSPATGLPAITGTVQVGETLTADVSGIADADGLPETFTHVWWTTDDDGVRARVKALAPAYTLRAKDKGKTVTLQVNFTDQGGTIESLTSEPTEAVVGVDRTELPHDLTASVSGDAIVLTWKDALNVPKHNHYQILRHRPELGEPEPLVYADRVHSTVPTFTDTEVEPGALYVYRVKAVVNWFGEYGEASLPAEIRMPDSGETNSGATGQPTITGTAQVGRTLRVDTSPITDEDGLTGAVFTYHWLADDSEIAGATDSIYTLDAGDEGKAVAVRVTFTDDAGNEESLTSEATAAVTAAPTPESLAPSGLSARVVDGGVSLSWQAPAADAGSVTGYQLVRQQPVEDQAGLVLAVMLPTGGTDTSFVDATGHEAGVSYTYRVRAVRSGETSEWSSEARATVRVAIEAAPAPRDEDPMVALPQVSTTPVPYDWSLIPPGFDVGNTFRLLFFASETRDATSTDIADYNTWIQNLVANGHADIQGYSSNFRVVGSTSAVHARVNTETTYTSDDRGVPIYWLGGVKVVDHYQDFYDGGWANEGNPKNENGNTRTDTWVWTGSNNDGTASNYPLGGAFSINALYVTRGYLDSDDSDPLYNESQPGEATQTYPLYGLSAVFQVASQVAQTPVNICGRSWRVWEAILAATPSQDSCGAVSATEMAAITDLPYQRQIRNPVPGIAVYHHIEAGDFEGLTGLTTLDLSQARGIGITYDGHPAWEGLFDPLVSLVELDLSNNNIGGRLPEGLFSELASLEILRLRNQSVRGRLDNGVFDGLTNLRELDMRGYYHDYFGRGQTWNPRSGSPFAFVQLTSLVTYNYDADAPYVTNNYTQPPPSPENVSATVSLIPGSPRRVTVTLQWDAPSGADAAGITGYRVGRNDEGREPHDTYFTPATGGGENTHFVPNFSRWSDFNAEVGSDVFWHIDGRDRDIGLGAVRMPQDSLEWVDYWITALTGDGESMPVKVTVTELTDPPEADGQVPDEAPALRVSTYKSKYLGGGGYWRLDWDPVDDHTVTGYEIGYRRSPDQPWTTLITNVGNVTRFDYDILHNRHFRDGHPDLGYDWDAFSPCSHANCKHTLFRHFRIRAINAVGTGPWSHEVSRARNRDIDSTSGRFGLHSHGGTMYTVNPDDRKVYAYDLSTGARDTTKEFDLDSQNSNAVGIWSNDQTMWVSDVESPKLYAYHLTGGRDSDKDITLASDNDIPYGIWSDGETMWVSNSIDATIYAYKMTPGANFGDRDKSQEITLASENVNPLGIWSDGRTMLVVDDGTSADKVYAYNLSTKARDEDKEFSLSDLGIFFPGGIWSDGEVVWVSSGTGVGIVAFALPEGFLRGELFPVQEGRRAAHLDIAPIHNDNNDDRSDPGGVWSNGTTMWVASGVYRDEPATLYAFDLASGDADPDRDILLEPDKVGPGPGFFITPGNQWPEGIWSNGRVMFVLDDRVDKVFVYDIEEGDGFGQRIPDLDIKPHSDNGTPNGITSDGRTLWVTENSAGYSSAPAKLYAYKLDPGDWGARDPDRDIALELAIIDDPRGVWTDGATVWVTDLDQNDWAYAYNVASTGRDRSRDVRLDSANSSPRGMWANNDTMWVVDWWSQEVLAYALQERTIQFNLHSLVLPFLITRDPGSDFNTLLADSFRPGSIVSYGGTMYVMEHGQKTIYAYDQSTKARDTTKEFEVTGESEDFDGRGVWTDGQTMWVADDESNKLYAYKVTPGADHGDRDSDKDITLASDNLAPRGIWSNGETMWVNQIIGKIFAYHLTDGQNHAYGGRDSDKDITFASSNRTSVDLWSDGATIWVVDSDDGYVYAYDLATKARVESKEFEVSPPQNFPTGIWSDGGTFWVADAIDKKIYAYRLLENLFD